MFLCETWLKPIDIGIIKSELLKQNYWCTLKSSVDPEVVLEGRSFGGVGLICKNIPGISYVPINIENERVCALKLVSNSKVVLTIIGVYMPYYDGSVNKISLYSETLDEIQSIIDTNDPSPVLLVGDMNASLPQTQELKHQWYRIGVGKLRFGVPFDVLVNLIISPTVPRSHYANES